MDHDLFSPISEKKDPIHSQLRFPISTWWRWSTDRFRTAFLFCQYNNSHHTIKIICKNLSRSAWLGNWDTFILSRFNRGMKLQLNSVVEVTQDLKTLVVSFLAHRTLSKWRASHVCITSWAFWKGFHKGYLGPSNSALYIWCRWRPSLEIYDYTILPPEMLTTSILSQFNLLNTLKSKAHLNNI